MKKSIRALFLAAFMFLTLFTMPAFAYDISAAQDTLTIENGVFTSENARPIQETIDQYFEQRESGNYNDEFQPANSRLVSENAARKESIRTFYEEMGYCVISYDNDIAILNAQPIAGTQDIEVTVNELTHLYYTPNNNHDGTSSAMLEFSNDHDMILAPIGNGCYQIIADSYYEEDVTGFAPGDYIAPAMVEVSLFPETTTEVGEFLESTANSTYMPNFSACYNYAEAHWNDTSSSTYGYAVNKDCCNFVSQCLKAGGFAFDPSSATGRSTSSTSQWWHAQGGNLGNSSCTWRLVESFSTYWRSKYALVSIKEDLSNVYPGNPIITTGYSHIGICVGYSPSGQPLFDAHTTNRHQALVTTSNFAYTILLNCTGTHNVGYVYNAINHFRGCTQCHYPYSSAKAHSYKLSGAYYVCTVCGYRTNNPAGTSKIVSPLCEMYSERKIV